MEEKTYFNIVKMTDAWREWSGQVQAGDDWQLMMEIWKTRALFTIAQQLSIISGTLKEIVQKGKDS